MEDIGKSKHREREGRERDRERRKKHKREKRSSKEKSESPHGSNSIIGESTKSSLNSHPSFITERESYEETASPTASSHIPSPSPVSSSSPPSQSSPMTRQDVSSPKIVVSTIAPAPQEDSVSLLNDKDENDIDRAVTQMMNAGPRITPAATEEKPKDSAPPQDTPPLPVDQKETVEGIQKVDEIVLKPEDLRELDPTLSSLMAAEYMKVCAEIESLELKRQLLSAYVDPTTKAQMHSLHTPPATTPSRKRKQAPSPRATSTSATTGTGATPGEKRRKMTGYIMFIQDQKLQSGEKGGIKAYSQKWKGLTDEEKAVWNKKAESASGLPVDTPPPPSSLEQTTSGQSIEEPTLP
eukprot:Protomagalhaensia_wolfi_Nauph_80__1226@NODE_1723_length_1380_cov_81_011186_g1339_i0_p1_GENE_NODE_1723_length_1380_cov_81_011186_g1339_i0NODE_1723_length_1380_cov_81_011186_g1339_i0_p1_ORF_typecomplete_len353_score78_15HMG_box_2/PF09011_10/3_5e03HMG_box_2/PF09011_10/5_1e06HMG_box/PF00505_19/2_3e03HMG_box/PF00505_19/0_00051Joubert/PF15392_6/0_08Joubert/PF15392_6/46_NODE_1723_length_1380_cov_81_011186_g1339_i02471305